MQAVSLVHGNAQIVLPSLIFDLSVRWSFWPGKHTFSNSWLKHTPWCWGDWSSSQPNARFQPIPPRNNLQHCPCSKGWSQPAWWTPSTHEREWGSYFHWSEWPGIIQIISDQVKSMLISSAKFLASRSETIWMTKLVSLDLGRINSTIPQKGYRCWFESSGSCQYCIWRPCCHTEKKIFRVHDNRLTVIADILQASTALSTCQRISKWSEAFSSIERTDPIFNSFNLFEKCRTWLRWIESFVIIVFFLNLLFSLKFIHHQRPFKAVFKFCWAMHT